MHVLKQTLKKILPETAFKAVRTIYSKTVGRHIDKRNNALVDMYTQRYIDTRGYVVSGGPFKGLRYVKESVGSSFLHKLAGYYEAVLIPYVEEVKKIPIQHIVDIGAAEGYYTTGFGSVFKDASITAFEMEEKGRKNIQELHNINNLKNPLEILGEATADNVFTHIKPGTLLICDCEGAEKNIFASAQAEAKNITYGILELHDELIPGCKQTVLDFFSPTHSIRIVRFDHANPADFTFFKDIEPSDIEILLKERGIQDQEWAIVTLK